MENLLSIVAIALSVISFVFALVSFIWTNCRDRKAATFETFNRLQDEVFDKINLLSKTDVKNIAEHSRDAKFTEYSQYLARVEQFCIGVFSGIYDMKITEKIAGKYLSSIYEKSLPVIEKKRSIYPDEPQCVYYEMIVRKINK